MNREEESLGEFSGAGNTSRRHKMTTLFPFAANPSDWQELLADKDKHWRTGYSAKTLAHSWTAAKGFPPEVAAALATSKDPLLVGIEPVLGIPEFKVPLPGGDRASQNDIFVLARSHSGPVSIMVEGKVEESFGPTLENWLVDASLGKRTRLAFLLKTLGLDKEPDGLIRYQLLHRAASAVIVGEQYRAAAAVLMVHSFSERHTGLSDLQAFAQLFGTHLVTGTVQRLSGNTAVPLFAVWVHGDPRFLTL